MNWLSQQLLDFIHWALDPGALIETAFAFVAMHFKFAGWVCGYVNPTFGAQVTALGANLDAVPFQKMWAVGAYLVSPVIDTTLLSASVAISMYVWLLTTVIKVVVAVKNHIWSAGA